MPDILLIEPCDFEKFPLGGQLSFAVQMVKVYGNRLALVGLSTDNTQVGTWTEKTIDGVTFQYFSIGYWKDQQKKSFIPARFTAYQRFRQYRKTIFSLGIRNAFIQAPEALIALSDLNWENLCYYFPGVRSTLGVSRRLWARPLAGLFDKALFKALDKANLILAAASDEEIKLMCQQSAGKLNEQDVIKFPTRVDTSVFKPLDRKEIRQKLGVQPEGPVFATSGRLHREKGWELILDAFSIFLRKSPNAHLYFIGDGWDRIALENQINKYGISNKVTITGFVSAEKVAMYLSAADVYLVGSYIEGWSLAMLEALACGKPIVSTSVSGARDMIIESKNGFIVNDRDPEKFAEAMSHTLNLENAEHTSLRIAEKYSVANLAEDLSSLWPPLQKQNTANKSKILVHNF